MVKINHEKASFLSQHNLNSQPLNRLTDDP